MMQRYSVFKGKKKHGETHLNLETLPNQTCQISVIGGELAGRTYEGSDFFIALNLLRNNLEERDLLLGCVGALVNFFPSNMARDMGKGKVGYLTTLHKKANRSDLARAFDPVNSMKNITTVSSQLEFHKKWKASLTRATRSLF